MKNIKLLIALMCLSVGAEIKEVGLCISDKIVVIEKNVRDDSLASYIEHYTQDLWQEYKNDTLSCVNLDETKLKSIIYLQIAEGDEDESFIRQLSKLNELALLNRFNNLSSLQKYEHLMTHYVYEIKPQLPSNFQKWVEHCIDHDYAQDKKTILLQDVRKLVESGATKDYTELDWQNKLDEFQLIYSRRAKDSVEAYYLPYLPNPHNADKLSRILFYYNMPEKDQFDFEYKKYRYDRAEKIAERLYNDTTWALEMYVSLATKTTIDKAHESGADKEEIWKLWAPSAEEYKKAALGQLRDRNKDTTMWTEERLEQTNFGLIEEQYKIYIELIKEIFDDMYENNIELFRNTFNFDAFDHRYKFIIYIQRYMFDRGFEYALKHEEFKSHIDNFVMLNKDEYLRNLAMKNENKDHEIYGIIQEANNALNEISKVKQKHNLKEVENGSKMDENDAFLSENEQKIRDALAQVIVLFKSEINKTYKKPEGFISKEYEQEQEKKREKLVEHGKEVIEAILSGNEKLIKELDERFDPVKQS